MDDRFCPSKVNGFPCIEGEDPICSPSQLGLQEAARRAEKEAEERKKKEQEEPWAAVGLGGSGPARRISMDEWQGVVLLQ